MNKALFYIIFFVACLNTHAQTNLVYNGSFEDTISCPVGADIFMAEHWHTPSEGTPDYFHNCGNAFNYGVPINVWGEELAHTGVAYGSILTYSKDTSYREYVMGELLSPLEQGSLYKVNFYLSLSEFSVYASNNIAIVFINDTNYFSTAFQLPFQPTLNYADIVGKTIGWQEIVFFHIAEGDEKYFIIGNFYPNSHTSAYEVNENTTISYSEAFYYLDDVSVQKVEISFPNIFTPNGDGINDFISFSFDKEITIDCKIYSRWGNIVYQIKSNEILWDGKDTFGNYLNDGVYFYTIQIKDLGIEKKGLIHLVK